MTIATHLPADLVVDLAAHDTADIVTDLETELEPIAQRYSRWRM
jgi:hypothetical protein